MKYNVGDRVAYMTRQFTDGDGNVGTSKVGYIKQVRKSLFGTRYVICVAKSDEVNIVDERNIFNKLERKERTDERTDTRI